MLRPHKKKKFSLSSYSTKKCHAGGRIFYFYFLYFFVCPSLAATYNFKAIKESINKTKLFSIDRLGEKAIIQSINLAKVFKQDVLTHS